MTVSDAKHDRARRPLTTAATDPREQRVRQNARLLAELADAASDLPDLLLLRECGASTCGSRVRLTRRQYERSRGAGRIIVAPGYGPRGDAVVLVADSFWVVKGRA